MRKARALLRFFLMLSAVVFTVTVQLFAVGETLRRGALGLILSDTAEKLLPQMINTFFIASLALLISMPLALGVSLWMYRTRKERIRRFVARLFSALSSVPSAVYGLFGYLFFGGIFSMRYSLLSGALTSAMLIMPPTVFLTVSALDTVEKGLLNNALALGAGEGRAILSVLLPSARGSILNAALLAASRVAAESAALLLTSGIGDTLPENGIAAHFMRSGATLTVGMYRSILEGDNDLAFSAGVVLMLLLILFDELGRRVKECRPK